MSDHHDKDHHHPHQHHSSHHHGHSHHSHHHHEKKPADDPHEAIIEQLWSTYDKNHNSRIDRDEFDRFMKDICGVIGRKLTPACYDRLFKKADTDHSGYLSKEQFAKLIKENIV